jgi:transposase InsO family protein
MFIYAPPLVGKVPENFTSASANAAVVKGCPSHRYTLERELLNRRRFKTQAEAKMAVFEWIEGWYNPHRRHSALGYRSPVNYERVHHDARARMAALLPPAAADSLSGKMGRAA